MFGKYINEELMKVWEECVGITKQPTNQLANCNRVLLDKSRLSAFYTGCPTRYRTRHFFNNFTSSEDIATKFEADYRHIPLHFSHNERTAVQISL